MFGEHISFARCVLNGRLGRAFVWCRRSAPVTSGRATDERRSEWKSGRLLRVSAGQVRTSPAHFRRLRSFAGSGLLDRAGIGCRVGGVSGIVVRCVRQASARASVAVLPGCEAIGVHAPKAA